MIEAEDKRLTVGCHAFEADNGFRWTDGDAAIPEKLLTGFAGPMEIALRLGGSTTYVDEGTRRRVA